METWVIGAIINLAGSVLINLGTNLIKYHHVRNERLTFGLTPEASRLQDGRPYFLWAGFFVFGVGNITNFISMGFAAQSLLSALGSVQFISNVAFASLVLKQRVTNRILIATFAIVVGNMLIVVFASHESPKLEADELWTLYSGTAYKIYMTILLFMAVFFYIFYKEKKSRLLASLPQGARINSKSLPFAYAAISGIIGTQSVILAKSSSELVRTTISGNNQFIYPFTYLIVIAWFGTMMFWLYRLNSALRKFDGIYIIPVLQVVWTLLSIIGGGIYFQEFDSFTPTQIALFTLGVVIIIAGVYLLSPTSSSNNVGRSNSLSTGDESLPYTHTSGSISAPAPAGPSLESVIVSNNSSLNSAGSTELMVVPTERRYVQSAPVLSKSSSPSPPHSHLPPPGQIRLSISSYVLQPPSGITHHQPARLDHHRIDINHNPSSGHSSSNSLSPPHSLQQFRNYHTTTPGNVVRSASSGTSDNREPANENSRNSDSPETQPSASDPDSHIRLNHAVASDDIMLTLSPQLPPITPYDAVRRNRSIPALALVMPIMSLDASDVASSRVH